MICSRWFAFDDLSVDESPCCACDPENDGIINYGHSDDLEAPFSTGAYAVGTTTAITACVVIFTVSDAINAAGLVGAAAILFAGVVTSIWPLWHFRHAGSRVSGYEPLGQEPENVV